MVGGLLLLGFLVAIGNYGDTSKPGAMDAVFMIFAPIFFLIFLVVFHLLHRTEWFRTRTLSQLFLLWIALFLGSLSLRYELVIHILSPLLNMYFFYFFGLFHFLVLCTLIFRLVTRKKKPAGFN